MRRTILALIAGTVFGAGLAISGMVDPTRVRAFLDLFGGAWDPTLAFVMAGALVPMAFAWVVRGRLASPIVDRRFALPDTNPITPAVLGGAALFGIGWGIAGLCPGPAVANLALDPVAAAPFVIAMLAGFTLYLLCEQIRSRQRS